MVLMSDYDIYNISLAIFLLSYLNYKLDVTNKIHTKASLQLQYHNTIFMKVVKKLIQKVITSLSAKNACYTGIVAVVGGVLCYKIVRKPRYHENQLDEIFDQQLNISSITLCQDLLNRSFDQLQDQELKLGKVHISRRQYEQISELCSQLFFEDYKQLCCPISLSLMTEPVILPCSHIFERKYIIKYLRQTENCPLCRRQTTVQNLRKHIKTEKNIENFKKKIIKKGRKWAQERIAEDFEDIDISFTFQEDQKINKIELL